MGAIREVLDLSAYRESTQDNTLIPVSSKATMSIMIVKLERLPSRLPSGLSQTIAGSRRKDSGTDIPTRKLQDAEVGHRNKDQAYDGALKEHMALIDSTNIWRKRIAMTSTIDRAIQQLMGSGESKSPTQW